MTPHVRPAMRSSVRFIAFAALAIVLIVSLWMVIAFAFGLSALVTVTLPVGLALAVTAWAILRLRTERAAHEAALTSWAASEAILAERLRIARDLHDIVSHGLGMITVRATAAAHLNAQHPNEHALLEALGDVEVFSREATRELRRMLETLREVDEPAPRHPTDNLASLPEIVAGAQRAGLRVELSQGELASVSPGVQLAVCAIVREGLSNSARHAGSTRTEVELSRDSNGVTVTIADEGPNTRWTAAPGAGHGLAGLRERVTSLGGTLEAGPDGTGFRLEARLPEGT